MLVLIEVAKRIIHSLHLHDQAHIPFAPRQAYADVVLMARDFDLASR